MDVSKTTIPANSCQTVANLTFSQPLGCWQILSIQNVFTELWHLNMRTTLYGIPRRKQYQLRKIEHICVSTLLGRLLYAIWCNMCHLFYTANVRLFGVGTKAYFCMQCYVIRIMLCTHSMAIYICRYILVDGIWYNYLDLTHKICQTVSIQWTHKTVSHLSVRSFWKCTYKNGGRFTRGGLDINVK